MPFHRAGVDEERAGSAVGKSRGHHQRVGAVAGQHRVLAAGHRPRITFAGSLGRHRCVRPAHPRLLVGEGQQAFAGGDLVEKRALPWRAEFGDQRSGPECPVQHRFGGQPPADLGEHHLDLVLPAGFLLEAEPQDADLGQLFPHITAEAEPTLGVVGTGEQVAGGVAEQNLLFAELKVHGSAHNPRMVDAMMVRCTSLLPP